jgi:Mitochondrial ribosomal protein L28
VVFFNTRRFTPEFSAEELAEHSRIAKEYARQSMKRHNQQEKDLTTKIWLQQEAMRAMSPELRAQAEIIDDTPPPPDRPWPIWLTPPIKGFNPRDYLGDKDDVDEDEPDSTTTASDKKVAKET